MAGLVFCQKCGQAAAVGDRLGLSDASTASFTGGLPSLLVLGFVGDILNLDAANISPEEVSTASRRLLDA